MRLAAHASLLALLAAAVAATANDPSGNPPPALTDPVSRPRYTPSKVQAPFFEQFDSDWSSRWKVSSAKKVGQKSAEEWAYIGKWEVEQPSVYRGLEGDFGLVVKSKAAHHAISARFPSAIDNTGSTLVVQYEVKLQNGLECGGAYLKLLQDNAALHAEEFSNATPYVIMFGPDKCGSTNKVHFIFRHKNPKTGEYEEKHLKNTPPARILKTSSLYTLIVRPDQTYEIRIDGQNIRSGSLLQDFSPAVNPEKEIDDPNDVKPTDWVDDARIPDPDATKPDDWDEDAPFEIVDEEAVKPNDWLEEEPVTLPDPDAKKPSDWNDEEDGDWTPSSIPNPRCADASGCGPWNRPMKPNPDYKGKWTAPLIDNPAYKGVWKPRKIANPDYYEDLTPANFEPIGAIGFEIWTMQDGILFDNIYIGHSEADAANLQKQTFDLKVKSEKAQEEQERPKTADDAAPKFSDDPVSYLRIKAAKAYEQASDQLSLFMNVAREDPVMAVRAFPTVGVVLASIIGVLALILLALIFGRRVSASARGGSSAAAATRAAGAAVPDSKEKSQGKASGVDTPAVDATKRPSRSVVAT